MNDDYHGIIGHSDDSFLLAPSLIALQEMLENMHKNIIYILAPIQILPNVRPSAWPFSFQGNQENCPL